MSLLLLFNGRPGFTPTVVIQTYAMGGHGVGAVISLDGRVSIIDADGLIAIAGDGIQGIIVDGGVSAATFGVGIRSDIE